MLTIGELARAGGTTVRAVRHYHQTGLFPEPERDHSGYRRYGTTALLRLLRIRRMRELGLALDRIAELLDAPEPDVRDALDALDAELAAQAERIAEHRARLAGLRGDLELPDRAAEVFAAAAAAGAPVRVLQQEREALLLDLALHPERETEIVDRYVAAYERMRTRPGYAELVARFDAIADRSPDDPEVDEIARWLAAYIADTELRDEPLAPLTEKVFRDWGDGLPPAQRRVMDRVGELLESAPRQQ